MVAQFTFEKTNQQPESFWDCILQSLFAESIGPKTAAWICIANMQSKEKMLDDNAKEEDIYHARLVATLAVAMSSCLSVWSTGHKPMLSVQERNHSFSLGNIFCTCYSALAREAFNQKKLLWKIRPKHHYWVELLDYMYKSNLNPMSTSNFLDEDMMKAMRGVAKACHPKTVKHAWARRYLLKKVIAWSQGGEKKTTRPIAQVASHFQRTVMQRLLAHPIYHRQPFVLTHG